MSWMLDAELCVNAATPELQLQLEEDLGDWDGAAGDGSDGGGSCGGGSCGGGSCGGGWGTPTYSSDSSVDDDKLSEGPSCAEGSSPLAAAPPPPQPPPPLWTAAQLGPPVGPMELHASESILDAGAGASAGEAEARRSGHLLPVGTVVGCRYCVKGWLGSGSFGAAYVAEDLLAGGRQVAIKARVSVSGTSGFSQWLREELEVYVALGAAGGQSQEQGIPAVFSAGVHALVPAEGSAGRTVFVSYIAMQRLGANMWALCHRTAPRRMAGAAPGAQASEAGAHLQPKRPWVVETGQGMLRALAAMHARGWIHKDVKTENFCAAAGDTRARGAGGASAGRAPPPASIFLIDFGFARPAFGCYDFATYHTTQDLDWWGTPSYASIASLECCPPGPRDDLEALVYCLAEMEQPGCLLPWHRTLVSTRKGSSGWSDKQLARMAGKKLDSWRKACGEGSVPPYVAAMFDYVFHLMPWEVPDYCWMMDVLRAAGADGPLPPAPAGRRFAAWPEGKAAADRRATAAALSEELKRAASSALVEAPAGPAPLQPLSKRRKSAQQLLPAPGQRPAPRQGGTARAAAACGEEARLQPLQPPKQSPREEEEEGEGEGSVELLPLVVHQNNAQRPPQLKRQRGGFVAAAAAPGQAPAANARQLLGPAKGEALGRGGALTPPARQHVYSQTTPEE